MRRHLVYSGVGLVALFVVSGELPSFHQFVATRMLIVALFAMAYDLVKGYGGLISLCHAMLFGSGGYGLAIALVRFGLYGWAAVGIGIVTGAVLGALVAVVTLRTHSVYFLLLTLVIGQASFVLAETWVSVTGGEEGLAGFKREDIWGALSDDRWFLVAAAALTFLVYLGLRRVVESAWGLGLRGIRDSLFRTEALGWSPAALRTQVFALSGGLAALAGILATLHFEFVGPGSVSLVASANITVITVLGGPGTLIGPAVAGGVFALMTEVVSSYTPHWQLVLGIAYIAIMMLTPNGLVWSLRRSRLERAERVAKAMGT